MINQSYADGRIYYFVRDDVMFEVVNENNNQKRDNDESGY